MYLLELRHLTARYGKTVVLRNLDLAVAQGEITSIIGPNGAGKTTLFRSISGQIAYEGEIFFIGNSLKSMKPEKIVQEGVIQCPEGRLLFPGMSVLDNLEMGAYLRKDRLRVGEDLEYIFSLFSVLRERRNQLAGTLSGGEQQMLAIGRSIMSRPKLLMLDEPSFGLSPLMKEFVSENIKIICKKGQNILLNEQDTTVAMEIAEKFCILDNGKIVFEGTKDVLLMNKILRETYLGLD